VHRLGVGEGNGSRAVGRHQLELCVQGEQNGHEVSVRRIDEYVAAHGRGRPQRPPPDCARGPRERGRLGQLGHHLQRGHRSDRPSSAVIPEIVEPGRGQADDALDAELARGRPRHDRRAAAHQERVRVLGEHPRRLRGAVRQHVLLNRHVSSSPQDLGRSRNAAGA
jgi:hypothetical protein